MNPPLDDSFDIQEKNPKIEMVRDLLRTKKWAELKGDADVYLYTISENGELDAASMIMMERAMLFGQIFQKPKIDSKTGSQVLRTLAGLDLNSNPDDILAEIQKAAPGLAFNEKVDLKSFRNEILELLNATENLKKVSMVKMAANMIPAISLLKRIPTEKLAPLIKEGQEILGQIQKLSLKSEAPPLDLRKSAANFLMKCGHLKLQAESMIDEDNVLDLMVVLQQTQDALNVIKIAHETNRINELDNPEIVTELLAEAIAK